MLPIMMSSGDHLDALMGEQCRRVRWYVASLTVLSLLKRITDLLR